jgi:hypothetical protein
MCVCIYIHMYITYFDNQELRICVSYVPHCKLV